MDDRLYLSRSDYDRMAIPTIRVAFVLSLLLHIAVLWTSLPRLHLLSLENPERGNATGPLIVQLAPRPSREKSPPPAPPPSPPPTRSVEVRPPPPKPTPPPKVAPRPRPQPVPPVIALNKPAPRVVVPQSVPPEITPAPPPITGDLSSYIEARRRARGEITPPPPRAEAPSTSPQETERERENRIVAENLGLLRTPTFGYDPKGAGGIFQIQRMDYDSAEFIFFGWNKTIRRNTRQLIEVERGNNSDIRIAVIRKMIAIIRETESGDFVWLSKRLGREITLSARPSDNAGLEEFLMQDMFAGADTGPPS